MNLKNTDALLDDAAKLLLANKWQRAERILRKLLKANPGNPEGLHLAGVRTIERTKDVNSLHAHFVGVDHAAPAVGFKGFLGVVVGEPTALVEEIKTPAAGF